MTVIDLEKVKAAREAPDGDLVDRDQYGRPMYRFSVEYQFDGKQWDFHIDAYSLEDAERRVAAMREGLTVYGQVYGVVPA